MSKYATGAVVLHTREEIDDLDERIIQLIGRRLRISKKIQKQKIADGLSRVDIARENEIRERYYDSLGENGASIAASLLRMARG